VIPSFGFGELVFIFLAVLVVFGSRRMPELARMLGKAVRELRKVAEDFRNNIGI